MDALPQELKQHPKPVIAFLGLSDVTHCVFDSVAAINDQSGKVLCKFIKLSLQHQFPIKKESIFRIYANWGPKSESIREVLKTTGFQEDAVLFIDDSSFEC